MLKRMSTALFHPRFIAKFIGDKLLYVFSYVFLLSLLTVFPFLSNIRNVSILDMSHYDEMKTCIKNSNYKFEIIDGIIYSGDFEIKIDSIYLQFGNIKNTKTYSICFNDDHISYKYNNITLGSKKIDKDIKLNISNESEISDIYSFVNLYYDFINSKANISFGLDNLVILFSNLTDYLSLIVCFFILGMYLNTKVNSRFRIVIACYSITGLIFCDVIYALIGLKFIHYIGIIYSIFAFVLAMKSILSIEIKRR